MRVATGLLLVELLAVAPATAVTFSEGRSAYDQNRLGDARRIFAEVAADQAASAADRSAAQRELARIAWLADANAKNALARLVEAQRVGDQPCDTMAMTARVLREAGRPQESIERGDALLSACSEPSGRDAIRTHLIGARLDLAATNPSRRSALLAAAVAQGREFTIDADVDAARVRLETALMTGDLASAMAAWKDYFWLDDSDAPQALASAGVTAIFDNGLRAGATADDRLKLADILMRTGFATQSRRFAESHRLPAQASSHPTFKRLQAYWSGRDRLEASLLRINRRFAREGKAAPALKQARAELETIHKDWLAELVAAAGGGPDTKAVLRESYGLVGTDVGETDNYPGLHLGHAIEDRDETVTQYGKSAKIHYISIDNLLANGFISWLWDGTAMVGGWAATGVIVNVRPGSVRHPLRAFKQVQDSPQRSEILGRQTQRATEDLAKLKTRTVATLEGLNDRLQLQLNDRIAAVAHSKSDDDVGFRRAFLSEFSRANFDQSIRTHEGRHAIDEALGITANVEPPVVEYQSKLSELALTDYPRMALRNMNRNLEGDGHHDKAGARIFDEYRKWMEANAGQIIGYDPAIPALVQLDKLTDSQIREIARGLDPLPNGRPSPSKF